MNKREAAVERLFSRLAPHYGLLNTVLTFGLHHLWRRFAVSRVPQGPGMTALDLCAGTGDFAAALLRTGTAVVAADLSAPMLAIARRRTRQRLPAVVADGFHLPFATGSFGAATVGFGLRHSQQELPVLLREIRRVLKPGAKLVVLELSHPPSPIWRWLTGLYMHALVPLVGAIVDAEAYRYLSESLHGYPDAPALRELLLESGFSACEYHLLTGGVVAVHVATA